MTWARSEGRSMLRPCLRTPRARAPLLRLTPELLHAAPEKCICRARRKNGRRSRSRGRGARSQVSRSLCRSPSHRRAARAARAAAGTWCRRAAGSSHGGAASRAPAGRGPRGGAARGVRTRELRGRICAGSHGFHAHPASSLAGRGTLFELNSELFTARRPPPSTLDARCTHKCAVCACARAMRGSADPNPCWTRAPWADAAPPRSLSAPVAAGASAAAPHVNSGGRVTDAQTAATARDAALMLPPVRAAAAPPVAPGNAAAPAWREFFHTALDVPAAHGDVFRVYLAGRQGPLVLCLHGAGHTGLSFAQLSQPLASAAPCRVAAVVRCFVAWRRHGKTCHGQHTPIACARLAADEQHMRGAACRTCGATARVCVLTRATCRRRRAQLLALAYAAPHMRGLADAPRAP
jgi:hypothetical protein